MRHTEPNTWAPLGLTEKLLMLGGFSTFAPSDFLHKENRGTVFELTTLEPRERLHNRSLPGLIIGTVIDHRSG